MNSITNYAVRALLVLLAGTTCAYAASTNFDRLNGSAMNYGFLFAENPASRSTLVFTDLILLDGFADWDVDLLTPTTIVYRGPTTAAGSARLRLNYDYFSSAVAFQWAEVRIDNGAMEIAASGREMLDMTNLDGWVPDAGFAPINLTFINDYFASPPAATVPLPSPLLLMLPAAALLGFSRRRGAVARH